VNATATESPPTRRCPHCAAPMAPEQDWCLECGNAVTTRVSRAAGWGWPLAIVLVVLLIVGAVVFLVLHEASDDSEQAAGPATRTVAAPPPYRGAIPVWQADAQPAYTIVAFLSRNRPAAEARARRMITAGQRAGVLRTTGYSDFTPGLWIAWSGRYADSATAVKSAGPVRRLFPDAKVRLIQRAAPPPPEPSAPASTQPSAQSTGQ
jgi:predicted nucleic acid-binding Zn ribbon protein